MEKLRNVLVICTSKGMEDSYRRVLGDMDVDIDVEYIGPRFGMDMDASLSYVRGFAAKGKDVAVSRGFYAQALRSIPEFRVIDIPVSAQDVLKALMPYAGKDVILGIVECQSFAESIESVAKILGFRTKVYIVEKIEDFYTLSRKAVEDGASALCGGAMKYYDSYFQKLGVQFISIESSEESIRSNLENVLALCQIAQEEKRKRKLVETLVNASDAGVIAVDADGRLVAMNRKASEITGVEASVAAGKILDDPSIGKSNDGLAVLKHAKPGIYSIHGRRVLVDIIEAGGGSADASQVLKLRLADEIISDDSRVRNILAKKGLQAKSTVENLLGDSSAMDRVRSEIINYAKMDSTVLITGESGTGKEIAAQAIHNVSSRRNKPFVAINCSAFQPSLLESELFGYAPGAFTGAKKEGKAGLFEIAHTGTLFLDEIGEMDFGIQAKLLRAIQEKEFIRVGDEKLIHVDVRVIAATNKNLIHAVQEGAFREDLYYRLNVLRIYMPPLRQRREDIDIYIDEALRRMNRQTDCGITGINPKVRTALKACDWRGNVRELNAFLERLAAFCQGGEINMAQAAPLLEQLHKEEAMFQQDPGVLQQKKESFNLKLLEEERIREALKASGYNKTKAAALLGIDRVTLSRKLKNMEDITQ